MPRLVRSGAPVACGIPPFCCEEHKPAHGFMGCWPICDSDTPSARPAGRCLCVGRPSLVEWCQEDRQEEQGSRLLLAGAIALIAQRALLAIGGLALHWITIIVIPILTL